MNRQSLLIAASIIVGCMILSAGWNRSSSGQAPAAVPSKIGKYQIAVAAATPASSLSPAVRAILCDTETGQVWFRDGNLQAARDWADWKEFSSPIRKE